MNKFKVSTTGMYEWAFELEGCSRVIRECKSEQHLPPEVITQIDDEPYVHKCEKCGWSVQFRALGAKEEVSR